MWLWSALLLELRQLRYRMHLLHWWCLLLQVLYGQAIGELLLLRLGMLLEVLLLLLLDLLRRLDRSVRWR